MSATMPSSCVAPVKKRSAPICGSMPKKRKRSTPIQSSKSKKQRAVAQIPDSTENQVNSLPVRGSKVKKQEVSTIQNFSGIIQHDTNGEGVPALEDNRLHCVLGLKLLLQKRNQENQLEERLNKIRDFIIPMRNSLRQKINLKRKIRRLEKQKERKDKEKPVIILSHATHKKKRVRVRKDKGNSKKIQAVKVIKEIKQIQELKVVEEVEKIQDAKLMEEVEKVLFNVLEEVGKVQEVKVIPENDNIEHSSQQ